MIDERAFAGAEHLDPSYGAGDEREQTHIDEYASITTAGPPRVRRPL